jgi:hypothetical protein
MANGRDLILFLDAGARRRCHASPFLVWFVRLNAVGNEDVKVRGALQRIDE